MCPELRDAIRRYAGIGGGTVLLARDNLNIDTVVAGSERTADTRSIRSFESMMSSRSRQQKADKKDRMSLTDRLAHMSRLTRGSSHSQEASAPHVCLTTPLTHDYYATAAYAIFDRVHLLYAHLH